MDIDDAILCFFKVFHWGTPKAIRDVLYPDFEKPYSEDTFRVLLQKRLRRLPLVKHELSPYYVDPKYLWEFNVYLSGLHLRILRRAENEIVIGNLKTNRFERYSPREYFLKEMKEYPTLPSREPISEQLG